jgi:N-formylglutamate deformylase
VVETLEQSWRGLGYRLLRNNPYAGGFTTQHYGDPANGIHAVQVEINRAIYMDEATLQRRAGFAKLRADLRAAIAALSARVLATAGALHYQRLSAE